MKNKFFIVLFFVTLLICNPIMIKKVWPNFFAQNNSAETIILASMNSANASTPEISIEQQAIDNEVIDTKQKEEAELEKNDKKIEENTENIKTISESQNENTPKKSDSQNPYFDDALFIGDSRTVGIKAFGNIKNATFFANTGMSVYNLPKTKVNIDGLGKVTLDELLAQKKFGKVYILLGINELGYDLEDTVNRYNNLVEKIKLAQENALIYIEANLHVTEKKSNSSYRFSNERINELNDMLKELSNGKDIVYIDINEKFDDENGNLPSNFTQDGIHIYAKYYKDWTNWLEDNTVNNHCIDIVS